MKKAIFTLAAGATLALLSGCATYKIGPQAQFAGADQKSPPLEVFSAFREDLCTQQLGYLVLSVRNPSDEWKSLSDVQLVYPYSSGKDMPGFHVIGGKEILAWADAQELKSRRDNHNAAMARLATQTVGRLMINSDNNGVSGAGAGILAASVVSGTAGDIKESQRNASRPAGGGSNHLLSDELLVPPKMDRSFWILLGADNNAPMMGWLGVRYKDESNSEHQFVASPSHWEQCGWQKARASFLLNWGRDEKLVPRWDDPNSKDKIPDALTLEAAYQKQQKKLASQ